MVAPLSPRLSSSRISDRTRTRVSVRSVADSGACSSAHRFFTRFIPNSSPVFAWRALRSNTVSTAAMPSVPSAARRLDSGEAAELAAAARALPTGWGLGGTARAPPTGWVLVVEAPHGQLAIGPRSWHTSHYAVIVADPSRGRITRHPGAVQLWSRHEPRGETRERRTPRER